MPYTPIVATLGYVLSPDGREVLMLHRNARADDHHLGKYNGLGGKIEPDEDVLAGMRREIHEEAGIDCDALIAARHDQLAGFRQARRGLARLRVRGDRIHRHAAANAIPKATLEWVAIDRLHELPMWEGDREFLPLVFDADPRPFHGVMPYRDGRMQSWRYSRA